MTDHTLVTGDQPVQPPFLDWHHASTPLAEVMVRGLRMPHSLDIVVAVPRRVATLDLGPVRLTGEIVRSTPRGAGGWRVALTLAVRQEDGSYHGWTAYLARWCSRLVGSGVAPWQAGVVAGASTPRVG